MIGIVPIGDSASPLIAPPFGHSCFFGMAEQNPLRSDSAQTEPQSDAGTGSIHERVETLREKASALSETFDRIEKTLLEAERESND